MTQVALPSALIQQTNEWVNVRSTRSAAYYWTVVNHWNLLQFSGNQMIINFSKGKSNEKKKIVYIIVFEGMD